MNPFGNAPKQVEQYDLNGKMVAIFNSLTEATKKIREKNSKANISNISACCNGIKDKAYGYIWKFKERN